MKKFSACILFVLITSSLFAQRFEWLSSSRQYNSNSNMPVATDATGNVYTLIDVDPTLSCVIQGDTIHAVVPGASGTIVAKFGPTGNFIWGKMINPDGGGIYGGMIAVDNAGSVYASVLFPSGGSIHLSDTVYVPNPVGSSRIIKFTSNGNFVRVNTYNTGNYLQSPPVISCLGTDLYVGVGTHVDKLDSAFNTIWTINDPTNTLNFGKEGDSKADIFVQTNGQLVVSCWEFGNAIGAIPFGNDSVRFHIGGLDEAAIIKLDTSGQVLWTRALASNEFNPAIRAVCLDVQGNVYLGLEDYNTQIVFGNDTLVNPYSITDYSAILKWNTAGNPVRAMGLYPGSSSPVLMDLAVNAQSAMLVSGMLGASPLHIDANDSIQGYGNFYLIKYDSAGVYQWFKTEANNTSTFIDGIAVRNGNEYVLGGSTGTATNYQFDCIPDPTLSPTNFVTLITEQSVILPHAAFNYSADSLTYIFNDQSQNETNRLWNFGDGDTSTLQNPVHTYTAPGNYTVTLTAFHNACSDDSAIALVITGIPKTELLSSLNIYPNPFTEKTTVEFSLMKKENVTLQLNDVVGNEIREFALGELSGGQHHLEVITSDLVPGIYFLEMKIADEQVEKILIRQ